MHTSHLNLRRLQKHVLGYGMDQNVKKCNLTNRFLSFHDPTDWYQISCLFAVKLMRSSKLSLLRTSLSVQITVSGPRSDAVSKRVTTNETNNLSKSILIHPLVSQISYQNDVIFAQILLIYICSNT